MILHIATFTWKDDVTEADIAALTVALEEMAPQIPQILSYVAGPNLHLRPGGAAFGVAAVLEDAAGLDTYLDHPLHKAVYDEFLGWMIDQRAAAQLPISEGSLK